MTEPENPELELANEIIETCEKYEHEYDDLTSKECVDAVGIAKQKLIELGWFRR